MKQEVKRPARGLSLYMSILSAAAIEVFTFFEFEPTVWFFCVWTTIFAVLCLWELTHEIKRSRKSEEKDSDRALSAGQKPVLVIDLDQEVPLESEEAPADKRAEKRPLLSERISHLRGLEECLLVVSFGVLALINLGLALSVVLFGLSF